MNGKVVAVGVPTALGGHLAGMERTPRGLRELGVLDRITGDVQDVGDLRIEPGFRADDDTRAKNRDLIAEFLPREAELVAENLARAGDGARLLILGGDCTAHAGALAGLRRRRPSARVALAWFDAHGDFNTPERTPSGSVWGMPFAMICGDGDEDLVSACGGPSADPRRAALLGGQVLDEQESRALVRAGVAHFGSGMLATDAGRAALRGWATAISAEVDGLYIAIDFDVLDGAGGWAVQFPEPDGISLETATGAVRILAEALPVVGFGATGIDPGNGDVRRTADAVVELANAAFG